MIRKAAALGAMAYGATQFARRYAADHPDRVKGWLDKAETAATKQFGDDERVKKVADAARGFVLQERTERPRRRRATAASRTRAAANAS